MAMDSDKTSYRRYLLHTK